MSTASAWIEWMFALEERPAPEGGIPPERQFDFETEMEKAMSTTETKTEQTRRDLMHVIEGKHLGRCMDQLWGPGRRTLVELMELKDSHEKVVIVKQFEDRVPSPGSSRNWPDLSGVWVYVPIDDETNTWEGLDCALASHRARILGRIANPG